MQRSCTQNMCLFAVALALASAAPTADRHRHHSTQPDIWLELPSTTSRLSKLDAATLIEIDDAKDLDALKSKFREFIMESSTSDTMECPSGQEPGCVAKTGGTTGGTTVTPTSVPPIVAPGATVNADPWASVPNEIKKKEQAAAKKNWAAAKKETLR